MGKGMQTAEAEKKACRSREKGMQRYGKGHAEVRKRSCRGGGGGGSGTRDAGIELLRGRKASKCHLTGQIEWERNSF
jgi:hypothetical protein